MTPVHGRSPHPLLDDLLKRVSRSFYLTLAVLPAGVRTQLGLAYLFARAADTLADTDLVDRQERLMWLNRFRVQFLHPRVDWTAVAAIKQALVARQRSSAERTLLERLDDCFRLYLQCSDEDRERIRTLMRTLTKGMEMDLTVFPGDSPNELAALETMEELDRYIYYVAGCVGEFWTAMTCAHVPSLKHWKVDEMSTVGIRFGKGLQLTNVLKDVARDAQRGRCYLPITLLTQHGLQPNDVLDPNNDRAINPVLSKLIGIARDHLDQGWLYTMAIPRREIRLRLACMWPILFAGETLRLLQASADVLNPDVNVKISKGQVYRIMALTALTGGCGYVGTAYWGSLRKRLGA